MNLANLVAHLAVPHPFIQGFEEYSPYKDTYYSGLNEIVSASGKIKFPLAGLGDFYPKVICVPEEHLDSYKEKFPSAGMKDCEHVFITMEVPYEEEENVESFLPQMMAKRIYHLILICNLCHPGLFSLKASEICLNGNLIYDYLIPEMNTISIFLAEASTWRLNWPHYRQLQLIAAWEWLLSRKTYLETDGFDNDPISRALNAFSHLFEYPGEDSSMHLVWAMVGIETLFVRSDNFVKNQIYEGVKSILGYFPKFKEEFNKMYGFRSRFIHGGVDFPGLYFVKDPSPDLQNFYMDQDLTISFAITILVACLQAIISGQGKIPAWL